MRTPDSRAAPRLRFSEDEQLPVEQAEPAEKLTRKIKWQLPKEAEAATAESVPQKAAMQPLQVDRAADVISSDEIADEPLLDTTRHGAGETSRHRRSNSKALPKKRTVTQKAESSKKKEAALRFEEPGKKAPSRMKHTPSTEQLMRSLTGCIGIPSRATKMIIWVSLLLTAECGPLNRLPARWRMPTVHISCAVSDALICVLVSSIGRQAHLPRSRAAAASFMVHRPGSQPPPMLCPRPAVIQCPA